MARLRFQILIVAVVFGSSGIANSYGLEDDVFLDRVVPIFQTRCLECHRKGLTKGDFSLQDASSFFQDGYVERGDSGDSHLVELILSQDNHRAEMPKNGSLFALI